MFYGILLVFYFDNSIINCDGGDREYLKIVVLCLKLIVTFSLYYYLEKNCKCKDEKKLDSSDPENNIRKDLNSPFEENFFDHFQNIISLETVLLLLLLLFIFKLKPSFMFYGILLVFYFDNSIINCDGGEDF
jgi:hypothetical protein